MSAWPEAIYVIQELQKSLHLQEQMEDIAGRVSVIANMKSGRRVPDVDYNDFSENSLWLITDGGNSFENLGSIIAKSRTNVNAPVADNGVTFAKEAIWFVEDE